MMEQFLYTDGHTDGQTDTTKHYSPQTIRNGWGLKSAWSYLSPFENIIFLTIKLCHFLTELEITND